MGDFTEDSEWHFIGEFIDDECSVFSGRFEDMFVVPEGIGAFELDIDKFVGGIVVIDDGGPSHWDSE